MFKVGDTVEYTGKEYLGHPWLIGKKGIVKKLESDTNIEVDFGKIENRGASKGSMGCFPNNLRKVRSVENTLQIGDRVVTISNLKGKIVSYKDSGNQDEFMVQLDVTVGGIRRLDYHFESLTKEEKTTMDKVTVKLSNGLEVTGTLEQIQQVAKGFGISVGNDGIHYLSNSRGLIRITDMDKTHTKNALLKMHRTWSENLKSNDGMDLVHALRNGFRDKTFVALLAHYIDLS